MSIVKDRPSEIFFESIERFNIAKSTGALTGDELSKIITLVGNIFSNLVVSKGLKEEDVEKFETLIPDKNIFNYNHKELEVAKKTVEQANTVALMDQERISRKAQPVKRI